jgi:hypothetical protein
MSQSVAKVNLPDGAYKGYQVVYEGTILYEGKPVTFETNVGFRCGSCKIPMNWTITNGQVSGQQVPQNQNEPLNETNLFMDNGRFGMPDNNIQEKPKPMNTQPIDERSTSIAQQQAMGIAHAVDKGELPASKLKGASKEIHDTMKPSDVKDFAKTKHENLPQHVDETEKPANPLQVQETPKDNGLFKTKPMWGRKLSLTELVAEKWDKDVKIDNTGENTDKTIAQLKKEKEGASTKTKQQKNFAIRAKQGWKKGGITEGDMDGTNIAPAPDTVTEDVVGQVDHGMYAGGATPSQAFTAKKENQGMPVMEKKIITKECSGKKKYRMTEAQVALMKELVLLQEQTEHLNKKNLLY